MPVPVRDRAPRWKRTAAGGHGRWNPAHGRVPAREDEAARGTIARAPCRSAPVPIPCGPGGTTPHQLPDPPLNPLVDILLAVRDGARYLPAALDGLLAQHLREFRLLVVDDASTDETAAILAGAAARDRRITVLRNDTPTGLPASLNRGLAECTAPFLARADADDLYAPERLSSQLQRLLVDPGLGVLSCGYHRIDADGRRLGTVVPVSGHQRLRFHMLFMNGLLHPGVMLRTELLRRVGGYDTSYWTAQDSDLWARLSPLARIDNLEAPLVSYRVHPASVMKTRGRAGRELSLSVPQRLLSRYLDRAVSLPHTRALVGLYQGFETLDARSLDTALTLMRELDRQVRVREPAPVVRFFHGRVRQALIRQARRVGWRSPWRKGLIGASALTWRLGDDPRRPGRMRRQSGKG